MVAYGKWLPTKTKPQRLLREEDQRLQTMEIYRTFRPWCFGSVVIYIRKLAVSFYTHILATLKLVLTFGSLLRSHLGRGHMTPARAVAKETNI